MFQKAIVCKPCEEMIHGITSASLGKPDFKLALKQHATYVDALRKCGLEVSVLEADPGYPDSTFVEEAESYAANSVWINGTVLVPMGFPKTRHSIELAGYATFEVDVSEFQKLDGGLSCLSQRF